ncbi:MAG: DUF1080 domain-containing protein [Phycisphaerales bacterium]
MNPTALVLLCTLQQGAPAAAPPAAAPPAAQPAEPAIRLQGVRIRSFTDGAPPAGMDGKAVPMFRGSNINRWRQFQGATIALPLDDTGVLALAGDLATEQEFADLQLHLEFRLPPQREGSSIANADVVLPGGAALVIAESMNRPQRTTSCGAVLDVAAPIAAACFPGGAWQTYDVAYRAARVGADGTVAQPAAVTVLHNGVLVHNNLVLADKAASGPLRLRTRAPGVEVRNLWVRALAEPGAKPAATPAAAPPGSAPPAPPAASPSTAPQATP